MSNYWVNKYMNRPVRIICQKMILMMKCSALFSSKCPFYFPLLGLGIYWSLVNDRTINVYIRNLVLALDSSCTCLYLLWLENRMDLSHICTSLFYSKLTIFLFNLGKKWRIAKYQVNSFINIPVRIHCQEMIPKMKCSALFSSKYHSLTSFSKNLLINDDHRFVYQDHIFEWLVNDVSFWCETWP